MATDISSFLRNINLPFLANCRESHDVTTPSIFHVNIRKRAIAAEFFGTFFFMFAIESCVSNTENPLVAKALGVGFTLGVLVTMMAGVSGGCLNPAVSLGVFLCDRRALDFWNLLLYMVFEVFGAVLGGIVSSSVNTVPGNLHNHFEAFVFAPGNGVSDAQAAGAEIVATTVLCLMVQMVALAGAGGPAGGLVIGFSVLTGVIAIGPVSGGSMNPSISFAAFMVRRWRSGELVGKYFALYVLAPFLGSVFSAMIFHIVYFDRYWKTEADIAKEKGGKMKETNTAKTLVGDPVGDPLVADQVVFVEQVVQRADEQQR